MWTDLTYAEFRLLGQIALSMLFGAVIGYNREYSDKPAGLRTNMIVAGAATLLVGMSRFAVEHFSKALPENILRTDPIRVIEAIITGVSFIGAGTIIFRRGNESEVEGLTTAAALLLSAGVGVSVAFERWYLAGGVTVLSLMVLELDRVVKKTSRSKHIKKK